MRQLKQRITFTHHLKPLNREGAEGYVQHRLSVAGYNGTPLFSRLALGRLLYAAGGIPRLINILSHKSLMAAYGEGAKCVGVRHVHRAIQDTKDALPSRFPYVQAIRYGLLGVTVSACFVLMLGAFA